LRDFFYYIQALYLCVSFKFCVSPLVKTVPGAIFTTSAVSSWYDLASRLG